MSGSKMHKDWVKQNSSTFGATLFSIQDVSACHLTLGFMKCFAGN